MRSAVGDLRTDHTPCSRVSALLVTRLRVWKFTTNGGRVTRELLTVPARAGRAMHDRQRRRESRAPVFRRSPHLAAPRAAGPALLRSRGDRRRTRRTGPGRRGTRAPRPRARRARRPARWANLCQELSGSGLLRGVGVEEDLLQRPTTEAAVGPRDDRARHLESLVVGIVTAPELVPIERRAAVVRLVGESDGGHRHTEPGPAAGGSPTR